MSRVHERRIEPEILDEASDADAARNLREIARINWITGAKNELLRQLKRRKGPATQFTFLDVGAASGDLGVAVKSKFASARIICLDLMHRNLKAAMHPKIQGDAFSLPFADSSIDVVHCSLFLHHFTQHQVQQLIAEMHRVARGTVLIQDLHRHPISYYFLPATRWLFGWHEITVSDGMKSVAAGWRKPELVKLLKELNLLDRSAISWHFPSFRYFIAIDSTD